MILGFKEYFDKEKTQPTEFKDKIASGIGAHWDELKKDSVEGLDSDFIQNCRMHEMKKITSIRKGKRWEAGNLIHFATGVRTSSYYCFAKLYCKSVQDLQLIFLDDKTLTLISIDYKCYVQRDLMHSSLLYELCRNDGLTTKQFRDWFFEASRFDANLDGYVFEGQIIHWTDLKY